MQHLPMDLPDKVEDKVNGKEKVEGRGLGNVPKKCAALSMSDSLACLIAVDPVAMRQRMCSSNAGVIPLLNCAWRTVHNLRA